MISSNKSICTLHITDTTGSHQFPAMQRLSISKGHAFILVFSIAAKQSLEELKSILELVNEVIWSQFDVKALKLKVRHAQLTKCQSSWDIYKRLSTSLKKFYFATSHVWKLPKMYRFHFSMSAFSTNCCPIKTELFGNTVWPFVRCSKTAKLIMFSMKNYKRDIFGYFQILCFLMDFRLRELLKVSHWCL